ncbi:hypothetical protein PRIPAC_86974 [Pristionchus pacificus]|uniref:Uncharacterized protein n=1 Tax=Pristionchus pacificus TaxID=54126 RepID=A0A2A6BML3_PRIPA|nr:hypothetical protein PRIPAC_86974 [Pristionchus pacificus]|eukprot:PDM67212.1 hypothetical protein PRIPAC_48629 [Pristionchus pacificus]
MQKIEQLEDIIKDSEKVKDALGKEIKKLQADLERCLNYYETLSKQIELFSKFSKNSMSFTLSTIVLDR